MDEPILICDPPLGPRYVIATDQALTPMMVERVREVFDAWLKNPNAGPAIFGAGMKIEVLPGRYEWPDAEFCAA